MVLVLQFPSGRGVPQCIEGKWSEVVRDVLAALPPGPAASSDEDWIAMVREVGQSLTPREMEGLSAGGPLALSALGANRRALAERCLAVRQFGRARGGLGNAEPEAKHPLCVTGAQRYAEQTRAPAVE